VKENYPVIERSWSSLEDILFFGPEDVAVLEAIHSV